MVAGKARTDDVVRTKRLELVDDDGRIQAVLEATPGGPRFEMRDGDTPVLRVEVYGGQGALLEMLEPGGGVRVALNANPETGSVQFYGPGGDREPRVSAAVRLASDPGGSSLEMRASDGTPRARVAADDEGGMMNVYGVAGHPSAGDRRGASEPMASLRAYGLSSEVLVNQVCDLGGDPYIGPAAALTARAPEHGGGGHLEISDAGPDLVLEVPETRVGFPARLQERLVQATAEALEAEGRSYAPEELLEVYYEASDGAQGAVGRLAPCCCAHGLGSSRSPRPHRSLPERRTSAAGIGDSPSTK